MAARSIFAGLALLGSAKAIESRIPFSVDPKLSSEFRSQGVYNATTWSGISEVYHLNPTNKTHLRWVFKVNDLARKAGVSPERIVYTLARQTATREHLDLLKTNLDSLEKTNRQRVAEYRRNPSGIRERNIRANASAMKEKARVINVVERVLADPELLSLYGYVSSLGKEHAATRLKTKFNLPN